MCVCVCIYSEYVYIHVCMYRLSDFHFTHYRQWSESCSVVSDSATVWTVAHIYTYMYVYVYMYVWTVAHIYTYMYVCIDVSDSL